MISIIIAAKDEEKYIERCLNSLIGQDFPKDAYEILVADGRSRDKTREMIKKITKAMNADTKLWIIEYIIEPGPGFSVAKLLDIEVLVMSGGRERSIDEYETLVSAAALEVSRIIPIKSGPTMMECSVK